MIFCSALSAAGRSDDDFDRAPQIDRAGQRGVADGFFHGRGFAGEVRFIARPSRP